MLGGVDLDVPAGRFVALLGPSGCGKSTLLRLVAGLLDVQAGSIAIGGRSPAEAGAAKRMGLVPQTPSLAPWRTVLANVTLALEVNGGAGPPPLDPAEMLDRLGLASAAGLRPRQLSGGMAQRAALARALVVRPSVLLMDEPFSALDELTGEMVRRLLLELWAEDRPTVLFVTHSVHEAVLMADEVVVLSSRPGRVGARVPVGLPRPREERVQAAGGVAELEAEVRAALRAHWTGAGSNAA